MWITNEYIDTFLSKYDYDVRKSGDARWIDQKCTPDVLTVIADCVLVYLEQNGDVEFTAPDIQHFEYANTTVKNVFKKPSTNEPLAASEYDKFFSQPLKMFSYSKILNVEKRGRFNYYKVADKNLLQFLALREKNSLNFLYKYIMKVLTDSDLIDGFNNFFVWQNKYYYDVLKNLFIIFSQNNTNIKKDLEPKRIFTKIINVLAYFKNAKGTERGHVSDDVITYDMLMYNRDNFRDIYSDKPKGMTRREYEEKFNIRNTENPEYYRYLSQKAKRYVREYNKNFNHGLSEVYDARHSTDLATHMHHIFPEAEFPTISYYLENIIALTPTQHLNYAHVNSQTSQIDIHYQCVCLIAKVDTIKKSYERKDNVYDFNKFIVVLEVGLNDSKFENIAYLDFDETIKQINLSYSNY